ncbi:MAG: hypothetical protein HY675_19350 [Chloroflexi bacterium]|nr:hypothetical protein [Chloroflexota bacterium]
MPASEVKPDFGRTVYDLLYAIPSSRTTVYCFLNLGSLGLATSPELRSRDDIDVDAIVCTVEANRDSIKGIKVRMVGKLMPTSGVEILATANKIAKELQLPIMVHIGDPDNPTAGVLTRQMLPLLETGDILTHVFTAKPGSALDANGKVLPELKDWRVEDQQERLELTKMIAPALAIRSGIATPARSPYPALFANPG